VVESVARATNGQAEVQTARIFLSATEETAWSKAPQKLTEPEICSVYP